jgi:L-amino acid N-acyltransferase YncA
MKKENQQTNIIINEMKKEHWPDVEAIYLEGIKTKNATFETASPGWNNWNESHLDVCRFVLKQNNNIIGWAALGTYSRRYVYRGVAEVSIYVALSDTGKGFGTCLLNKLIAASEANGIWTLQAGIFPENIASMIIHKKSGFREVGIRKKLGQMDGIWRDVVLLERRSAVTGV